MSIFEFLGYIIDCMAHDTQNDVGITATEDNEIIKIQIDNTDLINKHIKSICYNGTNDEEVNKSEYLGAVLLIARNECGKYQIDIIGLINANEKFEFYTVADSMETQLAENFLEPAYFEMLEAIATFTLFAS